MGWPIKKNNLLTFTGEERSGINSGVNNDKHELNERYENFGGSC